MSEQMRPGLDLAVFTRVPRKSRWPFRITSWLPAAMASMNLSKPFLNLWIFTVWPFWALSQRQRRLETGRFVQRHLHRNQRSGSEHYTSCASTLCDEAPTISFYLVSSAVQWCVVFLYYPIFPSDSAVRMGDKANYNPAH